MPRKFIVVIAGFIMLFSVDLLAVAKKKKSKQQEIPPPKAATTQSKRIYLNSSALADDYVFYSFSPTYFKPALYIVSSNTRVDLSQSDIKDMLAFCRNQYKNNKQTTNEWQNNAFKADPEEKQLSFKYYPSLKPGQQPSIYINALNKKILLTNKAISDILKFSNKEYLKSKDEKNTDSKTENQAVIFPDLIYCSSFKSQKGPFLYIPSSNVLVPLSQEELKNIARFAYTEYKRVKTVKSERAYAAKNNNPDPIETEIKFYDSYENKAVPCLHLVTLNKIIELSESDLYYLYRFSYVESKKIKKVEAVVQTKPPEKRKIR